MPYIFIGTFLLAIISVFYFYIVANLGQIRSKWSLYRCNPLYMPFTSWIDPSETADGNFQKCMNLMGKDLVANMTDLFGAQIALIFESLSSILNPLKLFRTLFTTIRKFILSFTNSTLQKANGPTNAFAYLMVKIQDLLRKMSASGYITAFFGISFVSFIEGFVSLFISIIKGFIIAMLIIAVILALFNFPLLALVLYISSLLSGI
jgi:hypothetical protein